jgi:hypothetical protein
VAAGYRYPTSHISNLNCPGVSANQADFIFQAVHLYLKAYANRLATNTLSMLEGVGSSDSLILWGENNP